MTNNRRHDCGDSRLNRRHPMSDRNLLQRLAGVVVDFIEFVGETLGEAAAREAVIKDLGGKPGAGAADPPVFPTAALESIKAYRDAAQPSLEAELSVVSDVLVLLDAIASLVEVLGLDDNFATAEQLHQSLFDLLASNYVRLRWPRLFLILQGVATIDEITSVYGGGSNGVVNIGASFWALFRFLIDPGRTLSHLEPGAGPQPPTIFSERSVDGLMRLGAAALGWMHGNEKWKDITGDMLVGWDAPGLDLASPVPPRKADVIANSLMSFSFSPHVGDFENDAEDAEPLLLTLGYVPGDDGGSFLFIAFGGHLEYDVPLGEHWTFSVKLRSDAGVAVTLGHPSSFAGPFDDANFAASVGWASKPDETTSLSYVIPVPGLAGTRIDVGHLALSLALTIGGAEVRATIADSALVIDSKDADGFIRKLLGGTPLRLPFSLTLGYGSAHGRIIEVSLPSGSPSGSGVQNSPLGGEGAAGTPIHATIPIGRRFGPVTIIEIALRLGSDEGRTTIEADVSFSATLGPVYFRLDRVGLGLALDTNPPAAERNLRFVDAKFGLNPPLGIAVQVDTALVSGGGAIFHDPATGIYTGVLSLRLGKSLMLKAFGLVATKNPDGTPGSSFIIIGTIEGLGWQIGPVTVDGLGLLFASERTFDENAVRAALPTGQLKYLLFPTDPVHHMAEIMKPLATFFPAKRDSWLVGILVKLTFGRTQLVRLDLAFIMQFGKAVNTRLIVLGRLSSVLPTDAVRVVQLSLDAVGVFDFTAGTAELDAVLVDSKLCGRFPLTGAAAFRRIPGATGFALAVGGFHPRYAAPPGFPTLPRVTVALTNGDNPKLVCQAYIAITANTVQLGASASLSASACGFSIEGNVGFDLLIQLIPPHFLAEFRASVQLKRGSTNLFKVSVAGELEGPFPLRISGRATFEILWWDYSVSFDRALIGGIDPVVLVPIDGLRELVAALSDPRSWRAEAPDGAQRIVAVRRDDRPGQILIHPMGTLSVQQGVVPLNLSRDIDRLGEARPSSARRFAITSVTLGGIAQTTRPVRDEFAPGQFFDLTDDERLTAPSFDQMDAGVSFGHDSDTFARAAVVRSPFDYTDITIGSDGTPTVEPDPAPADGPLVLVLAGLGAAAMAPHRQAATRFQSPASDVAPVMRPSGYAVAATDSTAAPGPTMTWAEAHHHVRVRPGGAPDVVVLVATEVGTR
jgi:hypothetical protein